MPRIQATDIGRRRGRREFFRHEVVLAAKRQRAIRVREPYVRLAAEQQSALLRRPVVQRQPVFKRENRLRAAAQIFRTLKTEPVALLNAAVEYPCTRSANVAEHRNARVEKAVNGDAALRMSARNGERSEHCAGEDNTFHGMWVSKVEGQTFRCGKLRHRNIGCKVNYLLFDVCLPWEPVRAGMRDWRRMIEPTGVCAAGVKVRTTRQRMVGRSPDTVMRT
jgi:hypothetical protein